MTKTITLTTIVMILLLAGCTPQQETVKPIANEIEPKGIIVAMGDSLTAGYGLSKEDAYPNQLEQALQKKGLNYKVVNSGISGETSTAALSRVDWTLKTKPDIVILAIGGNDGLRGIDLTLTQENIRKIVSTLKEQDVQVILGGMQMLENLGPEYTNEFKSMYPKIAEEENIPLIPFFLEGVAANPQYNQDDQIHPTKKGYTIIVNNILPYVEEEIKVLESKSP